MIARALQRKGTALQKKGDLEGAIFAFSKSLTEHRTADTLKKLNDAERILKEKRQKEYEDPVKGDEQRELGNKLFKEQKVRPLRPARRCARPPVRCADTVDWFPPFAVCAVPGGAGALHGGGEA